MDGSCMAKRIDGTTAALDSEKGSASGRILHEYLSELNRIHATGAAVPETSYYPALSNLFNSIGNALRPKVLCVINLGNQGAGLPDGGLFTADQFQRLSDAELKPGQLPSRGAIERDAAEQVKRDKAILVVLGNPPYNAFAGVSPQEEQGLVEPYKGAYQVERRTKKGQRILEKGTSVPQMTTRYKLNDPVSMGGWGIKKFNLDDLYVRVFRLAERRIAEMSGKGVVSFISNHSWVSEPSFVVLRKHLLDSFDKFWIENLHGNRKISEYAPDGRTSETIFAISGFSVGIQQGVATSLWVKSGKPRNNSATVRFRDDINDAKAEDRRNSLIESLAANEFDKCYTIADPRPENRFSFRPEDVAAHYTEWPRLIDLCEVAPSNGLMEKRGGALIDIDRDALESRMRDYFDESHHGRHTNRAKARLLKMRRDLWQRRHEQKHLRQNPLRVVGCNALPSVPLTCSTATTRQCDLFGTSPVRNCGVNVSQETPLSSVG
jgi:hypothetical protein